MKNDVAVINYALYEDSTEYIGITQVDMPSLQFITSTIAGASGISGELEAVLIGQMKAMEITLKHTVLTKEGIILSTPKLHNWELREVQENLDRKNSALAVTAVKHLIRAFPKQMDGGSIKPQSTTDPSTVASVHYWAEYRDGKKVMELDPLNNICFLNGVDYLKPVRKALGK